MNTLTNTRARLSKTAVGAVVGALVALAWILLDTGAVILLLALTGVGATIGFALDQPERLISLLERLKSE